MAGNEERKGKERSEDASVRAVEGNETGELIKRTHHLSEGKNIVDSNIQLSCNGCREGRPEERMRARKKGQREIYFESVKISTHMFVHSSNTALSSPPFDLQSSCSSRPASKTS